MFFRGEFRIVSTIRSGWDVIWTDQKYRTKPFRNALITSLAICNNEYICISSKNHFLFELLAKSPAGVTSFGRGYGARLTKAYHFVYLRLFPVVSIAAAWLLKKLFSKTFSLFFFLPKKISPACSCFIGWRLLCFWWPRGAVGPALEDEWANCRQLIQYISLLICFLVLLQPLAELEAAEQDLSLCGKWKNSALIWSGPSRFPSQQSYLQPVHIPFNGGRRLMFLFKEKKMLSFPLLMLWHVHSFKKNCQIYFKS